MHSTIHAVCGQQKGQNRAKSHVWLIFKKKKKNFFFFLVSRYLGRDTIHVSPAQVSRCIDASMHRYDPNIWPIVSKQASLKCSIEDIRVPNT